MSRCAFKHSFFEKYEFEFESAGFHKDVEETAGRTLMTREQVNMALNTSTFFTLVTLYTHHSMSLGLYDFQFFSIQIIYQHTSEAIPWWTNHHKLKDDSLPLMHGVGTPRHM